MKRYTGVAAETVAWFALGGPRDMYDFDYDGCLHVPNHFALMKHFINLRIQFQNHRKNKVKK